MTVPSAKSTEIDGALGITPPSSGLPMVVVGQCIAGPFNTPAAFSRPKDIITNFGGGRAAEAAAYASARYGSTVVVVRTETAVAHAYSSLDDSAFAGSSTPVLDTAPVPNDDHEVRIRFPVGGTIGSDGIKYEWSLDGGRTYSPATALGTGTFIVIPGSGGIRVDFGGGTVADGDLLAFDSTAEKWDNDDLAAGLLAIQNAGLSWEFAQIAGALDGSSVDVVASWLATLHNAGKHKWAAGGFRIPTAGESEADYLTAFVAAFGSFADTGILMCAGAAKINSNIVRRAYRRPAVHAIAALAAGVSGEVDLAALDSKFSNDNGPLPGVAIRDALGNPEAGYHDESINPGLDDARACVLRTVEGEIGVYVNNPRLISSPSSDFDFLQKRRVMNEARTELDAYMRHRLSKHLRVNPKTGFLQDAERLSIEAAANQRLASKMLKKPKVSAVRVVLNKSDAITAPPYPLTGQLRMVPLAYAKEITIEAGWTATLGS